MLLGPAGVGKSSLVRGLKKQPFIQEGNSTQVADVRPISYNWATGDWKDVCEQDELDEFAKLLATVYHNRHDVKSVTTLYEGNTSSHFPASTEQVNRVKTSKVDSYLKNAITRANQLTPDDIQKLKPNPFLHVWDCGGQPIFLEVLPAFLTPRTEFLLLFDASKDFKERWKSVQYQHGREIPGEEVNMTISELLDKWMASIHSHLSSKTEKGDLLDYPRILGIGTHGDGLNEGEKQSVIDQFNTLCRGKAFSELMDNILVIDNTTAGMGNNGEDPGFERVRESILKFAKKLVVKTPVSWVLFRKIIQMFAKESKNVITFSEAKAIGVACYIQAEDIHKVLMFYHDLGVILYYSHIRNLQDKVILSPRWFVESLGKVLTLQGRENYQTREMWRILRENGILIQPLYVAVWRECDDIDPEGMMAILVSFHLAALVKTEVYYDPNAPQYFVPSVLPLFTGDLSSPVSAIVRATPLHITFSTRFVPPGYFTRFVTTMASFKACQLHFRYGIHRNLVSFKFGDGRKYDDIIFIELPHAIQVDISRSVPDSHEYTSFNKTCQDLLVVLDESCKEVDGCFHQSSPSNSIHRKFQFLCKSDECGPAADVHYLIDTEEGLTQFDHCCCEENYAFRNFTKEEAYWFPVGQQDVKMKRISQQEMLQISREIGGSGEDLAAQLGRLITWQEIMRDPTAVNKILNLLFQWDRGGGEREELVQHLKELQFIQLAEKLAGKETNSSITEHHSDDKLKSLLKKTSKPIVTPDNQSNLDPSAEEQSVKTKRISQQEILQISREISGSGEDLAAQLGRLQIWREIKQDPTAPNKVLNLLYEWDKEGGEREELVQHLKELGFIQLAEKIRKSRLASDETNSSNSKRHSDNETKSALRKRHVSSDPIEITVTDNSQSNLDCYNPPPLPVNLPLESPISRSSKPTREKSDEIPQKTREMSLLEKSDALEKELWVSRDEAQAFKNNLISTRQELQESQTLLLIEKKSSLVKSQELDLSRKQMTDLKGKLKLTSTFSPEEENMEDYTQESELVEEEKPKPENDKMQLLEEEVESFQKIVISKNEQVEELQSILELKEERLNDLQSLQEQLQSTLNEKEDHLQMQSERIKELEVTIQETKDGTRNTSSLVPQNFSDIISVTEDPSLHVARQKVFHIKGNILDWGDYGFKMNFPEGTIPPSQVLIKALVGGKFQFPDGMELVSALYVISFPEEYLRPVKLQIQHCVYLKSSRQFKYLSFITAPIDESVPPYKFQFIEGGKFYTDSQYGMIVRSTFCIMGIGKKLNGVDPPTSSDEEATSDTDSTNETQSTSENADVQSTENGVSNTGSSSEDGDSSSDTDSKTQSTSGHVDVQSTVDTEKDNDHSSNTDGEQSVHVQSTPNAENDKDPSSNTDGATRSTCRHSVSIGVQVPNDSNIPDNIYTGEVYYERTSSNKWLMRFMTVQNIKVFQQYIKKYHSNAVQDEIIRFSFLDPVNGYIQLIPDKQQDLPHTGWKIMPHKIPLVMTKRDADSFGSKYIPIPPSCLMTIRAKPAPDTEEDLSYAVPLKGIESDLEIYINRSLEIVETSNTTDFMKTSLKVVAFGIVGLLAMILLYLLVIGVASVFTKSNGSGGDSGGFIPDDSSSILLSHLSGITDVQPFCIHLGLDSDCDNLRQYDSAEVKKVQMLRMWQNLQRRTWRDFIHPFVMLQNCVKAQTLAKTYSVYFNDEEELKKCKQINNHDDL